MDVPASPESFATQAGALLREREMDVPGSPASFATQAGALLRKNLTFQRRNLKTNMRLVAFPIFLCVILVVLQQVINKELHKPKYQCGCSCIQKRGNGQCERVCGIQYSDSDQADSCPIPSPVRWPPLLQVPRPEYRSVKTNFSPFMDLLDDSCRKTQSCPASVLFTGENRSLADSLAMSLFPVAPLKNLSDYLTSLSTMFPGTDTMTRWNQFLEAAFFSDRPIYTVQPQCKQNYTLTVPIQTDTVTIQQELKCIQALPLWRPNSSEINYEIYKGYMKGNTEREINEVMAAYDFLNSNEKNFNLSIWYNSTYKNASSWNNPYGMVRLSLLVNTVSNSFLQFARHDGVKVQFDFTQEMPKTATQLSLDFSSLLSALFFKWVIELLFPVMLAYLVYEKQHKLRVMMKMHGLGDGPYWIISYFYFLSLSSVYVLFLVIFGSVIGLNFFKINDYSIQLIFYFSYINLQIALAFLAKRLFSDVKTAQVIGYIYIFGSGFLAGYLLQSFVEDISFPRHWLLVMEIIPAFSFYRGLYELSQYAFIGDYMGTSGMRWSDLKDSQNGMKGALTIIIVEWLALLLIAYYFDWDASVGSGTRTHHRLIEYFKRKSTSNRRGRLQEQDSKKIHIEMEKYDVIQERESVDHLLKEPSSNYAIICDNIKKVYSSRNVKLDKFAVRGLSLAVHCGECFGVLGPNGAGKTTFINMMIGLIKPTSGNAFVHGFSIKTDIDKIYSSIGVCPQNDMLWETLTGREHLLFYGRLKNLQDSALIHAVEESLRSVNLFHGGFADKQVSKYSGGMKRRLSVAISLIGDPKVVYMDEPSAGLDPASRKNLWNVVKHAKQNRAIILTTHSMEEADALCDRLGILVDGSLQCIGSSKELKARYGGSYVFTMTTSSVEETNVENLVRELCPNANKRYHISGTQKFELPKNEVTIAAVFAAVEIAKSRFTVQAWGLSDTSMEDVFVKVAKGEESVDTYS